MNERELKKREKELLRKEELMELREKEYNSKINICLFILAIMIISLVVIAVYNYNLVKGM